MKVLLAAMLGLSLAVHVETAPLLDEAGRHVAHVEHGPSPVEKVHRHFLVVKEVGGGL